MRFWLKEKTLDIGLNEIFVWLYRVYFTWHFFSISKIKLPRVLCKREEIKIKYGHRFKATVHFIWFIHSHIHLKFYLYESVRKMTCSLGWVIIIKNAHFLPRKWEERDLENVLCEANSVTSSINTAAFSTLLIIAELCLQIVESCQSGGEILLSCQWRPSSTCEEMQLCAQHSPPETSHPGARILVFTCRRVTCTGIRLGQATWQGWIYPADPPQI